MAVATNTMKNALCAAYAAQGLYLSLHTAAPGSTGASEVSAGAGGYARKSLTWGAPANGSVSATEVKFDAPAGTFTHWGLWSAASGGEYRDGGALAAAVTISNPAQISAPATYTQS